MNLSEPGILWLLVPLLTVVVAAGRIRSYRIRKLERFLHDEPGPGFWPRNPPIPLEGPRGIIRTGLLALASMALVVALAGFTLGTRESAAYRSTVPVVLMVDISRSMGVEDLPRGRLGTARLLIRRVAGRIPGAPLGLSVFAGTAHQLLPPGPDRELLFTYLESLEPDLVATQGTDLEGALSACADVVRQAGGSEPPLFLLFSDGESPSDFERLASIADSIRRGGGTLSTVTFGTPEGGEVPVSSSSSGLLPGETDWETGDAMQVPYSRANPDLMAQLAKRGGGTSALAQNAPEVAALLEWMELQAGLAHEPENRVEGIDRWGWLVALAALALLLEASLAGPYSRFRGIQWA